MKKLSGNRLGVTFISRAFAVFALVICFHSFFMSSDTEIKTQAIYWFCASLIAAVIPYIKDVAVYVESIKLGDVEIALNEVKKELQRVDNKVERLDERLMVSLSQVRQSEAALSKEARENRQQIYDESAQVLAMLPFEKKIKLQERLTLNHLNNVGLDVPALKHLFERLKYYQGSMDHGFSPELVRAIEQFQSDHIPGQIDGIAGPMTLAKIAELLNS